jgi:glutamate N-acetyltransferase/amino-acid N-acetyltransferase
MKIYKKAILPKGFQAGGVSAGIKKNGLPDVALFYSAAPALASCKFTSNKIQAAPVQINKKHLNKNKLYNAIIVNSGNANAFTGQPGLKDALETVSCVASALSVNNEAVLVSSTGIIGRKLPVMKIKTAIPELVGSLSEKGIDTAKKAIMTTDKFSKEITVDFDIAGRKVRVCGIAKGAGMIAPDLVSARPACATMLVFIFTDAVITQRALDRAMDISVDNSFNCITVDGCMSTNDTVILLANKTAENELIDLGKHFDAFSKALNIVCLQLAKMVVRDGEGATKFIRIKVDGARNYMEAKKVALNIANSSLFKTAMYASSPNIVGRIVASVGAAGIAVKEADLKIKYTLLKKTDVDIEVSVGNGKSSALIYTSDLTHEYVKINAEYN